MKKLLASILGCLALPLLLFLQSCSGGSSDPEPQLIADFSSDVQSIFAGESVVFSDQSQGDPTSWAWTFEGGTPATSTDPNPTVQYNAIGNFTVSLTVSNGASEDTKSMSQFISVACTCTTECTESCTEALLVNQSLTVNNTSRQYDLFLPSSYEYTSSLPVIIDLHGYTSDAEEQREISNFTTLAETKSIVMVWPEASATGASCVVPGVSGKYWNADLGGSTDDVAFIEALIDKVIADHKADPKRIYVTGLSNGGFMVYSLACAVSDRLAAIASVAGTMTTNLLTNNCTPTRSLPVLHIHGTGDTIIPYDGKADCLGGLSAVPNVVDFWRLNGGCSETFTEVSLDDTDASDNSTARMLTYNDCGNSVKFLIIDNGGHNWPGSAYQRNQGVSILLPINNDIDTNALIWEFFSQHQLP